MKTNVIALDCETIYHIYNRGVNGDNIFVKQSDADIFLKKLVEYTKDVADLYCYCLLKNHFHILVKIKAENDIRLKFSYKSQKSIHDIVIKQFSHFFNSYARLFQNKYERTGGLFETPFRRILVDTEDYFKELVYYIHYNPTKHGFTNDFKNYTYSSYKHYVFDNPDDFLVKNSVFELFGGKDNFLKYHEEK